MSMSKKDFIALADAIRAHNPRVCSRNDQFQSAHIDALADFCQSQNPAFLRDRWLSYISGENGKNGGKAKN